MAKELLRRLRTSRESQVGENYLAKRFEIPIEVLNPFRQIKVDARRFDPDYMREVVPEMAIAVGLALRGVDA